MKKLLALLLAIVLCFSLAACNKTPASDDPGNTGNEGDNNDPGTTTTGEPLKIGILTALTGASKETGDRTRRATELAVEEINANGGVLGQDVELVYFDVGADQQSFINALQAAVNTEGISATIGYSNSTLTVAGSEIIRESEIPNITLGNSSGIIALENPYLWQCRLPDTITTEILAKIHFETYGVQNPCIIWMTEAAGQSQHDTYVKTMESLGGKIAGDFGFDRTTTSDFTPIMTQVMATENDGLAIFCTNQQDGVLLAETVKNFGYDKPVATSSGNLSYAFVDVLTDGAGEGWFGISEFNLDADTPGLQDYITDVMARGSAELGRPSWSETANYDAVYYLAAAAEKAGSADPESINEGLSQLSDEQGKMTSYSYHDDHSLANYGWIAEIKGGEINFGEQVFRD
ncbi:ABC transporter substrate-binding protein [Feifania hominis]|uniref:ABC transporter substrate-binding protein n=1 Tax=Feifania hominis TaxID=2763660 RepID=A0A926DDQ8_9FIRM|nr:ABC transporter substrate-binding protein [Feifania hominis]MBC8535140.1 ABC transporter substrate-binding protein [Feifania hominis]